MTWPLWNDGGIVLLDKDGQVLVTNPHTPAGAGKIGPAGPNFKAIAQPTGGRIPESMISDLYSSGAEANNIVIAVPVMDHLGMFQGVLAGLVHIDGNAASQFEEALGSLHLEDRGQAYLIDSQGRVLYHPDPAHIGTLLTGQPAIQQILQGKQDAIITPVGPRERLATSFAPVRETPWTLVVEQDLEPLTRRPG